MPERVYPVGETRAGIGETIQHAAPSPLRRYGTNQNAKVFAIWEGWRVARWILPRNPERYRLHDALRDGFDVRSWTVSRYLREIAPCDEALMLISGPGAVVYALAEITSGAEQSADAGHAR